MEGVMRQGWFAGPSVKDEDKAAAGGGGSVLAAWNSYAASRDSEDNAAAATTGGGLDLEAGLQSASSSILGAFNSVTMGVQKLPGNIQSAASFVPSRQSIAYFSVMIGAGVFFIFLAFTMFLPVMALMPQKFAICFTLGCIFIVGSFFALKGPKAQLLHMISKERLPFTVGFLGSMGGTIYVSMVLHSYLLSVFFSVIQVLALLYYVISYFPGGSAGLQFITSFVTSTFLKCFKR